METNDILRDALKRIANNPCLSAEANTAIAQDVLRRTADIADTNDPDIVPDELPSWWPRCPYPKSIFPGGEDIYAKAVPNPHIRTAISGMLGREFWEIASGTIWRYLHDLKTDTEMRATFTTLYAEAEDWIGLEEEYRIASSAFTKGWQAAMDCIMESM